MSIDSGLTGVAAREREQMARQPRATSDGATHAVEDALPLFSGDVALEQLQTVCEHRRAGC